MSTLSKVLLGLVILATLPLFYLTAQTLLLYRNWGQKANQYEKAISQLEKDIAVARDGQGENEPGVRDLRIELEDLASRRGRAWLPVQKVAPPAADGVVMVAQLAGPQGGTVPPPEGFLPFPLGLETNAVVYAFTWPPPGQAPDAEAEAPAVPPAGSVQFVGSFRVREIDPNRGVARLEPVAPWSDAERRAVAVNIPWMIAELLPRDDHETFAGLDEQTLRQFLPPAVVEEYFRDGQPIPPNAIANIDPAYVKVRFELRTPESEVLGAPGEGDTAHVSVPFLEVTQEMAQAMNQRGMGSASPEGASFQRPLRDYGYWDREMRHRRDAVTLALQNSQRERRLMESAVEDARIEGQYRQREIQELAAEAANFEQEAALLKDYAEALDAMRREIQQKIEALRAENVSLARAS